MTRHVRGSLFIDYVRMLRAHKGVDWTRHLVTADLAYLDQQIDLGAWYPMASFERMGNAILVEIAGNSLDAVAMWGKITVTQLRALYPGIVAEGDPLETLGRFRVMHSTFFDFEAFTFTEARLGNASIQIQYFMGDTAEEAAAHQAMGFFEAVLSASGATSVWASFSQRK